MYILYLAWGRVFFCAVQFSKVLIFACLYLCATDSWSQLRLVTRVNGTCHKKRSGLKIVIIMWYSVGYLLTVLVFHDNNIIVYYYRVTSTLKLLLRVLPVV